MNYIELFAGCGGLSLGLETAGFELLIANELSPMAAETFAYNHLQVDLSAPEIEDIGKVYWLSSNHPRQNIQLRLRENPLETSGFKGGDSDLRGKKIDREQLQRSLIIGSIVDLNVLLEENSSLMGELRNGLGEGGVDLVSGGPPCQSFSLAGMRQHDNHRNMLPGEFANFVEKVQPKIALLENVSGILRAFKIGDEKHHAWFEVAMAFAEKGYVPICLHVNAKYIGAAQNRPRFILIAIRHDIALKLEKSCKDQSFNDSLKEALTFYEKKTSGSDPEFGSLKYHDVEKDRGFFKASSIYSRLVEYQEGPFVSVKEAIDDLRDKKIKESKYVKRINSSLHRLELSRWNKYLNHEYRQNSPRVQARFHLYQILSKLGNGVSRQISSYLRTQQDSEIKDETIDKLLCWKFRTIEGENIKFKTQKELLDHLKNLCTKKQTQRALVEKDPAPAALSIPDDACHYHGEELRTLTAREMARIQSFPDWYVFRSKVTTGGQMRKFEVPQYTQIGNAVPPLLGVALGELCKDLITQAG